MRLNDKTVVVLGGSSGMGLATAKLAHAEDANVVVAGRSATKLEAAKAAVGERVRAFPVDVTDEGSVRGLFDRLDRLDHLFVTTASDAVLGPVRDTDTGKLRPTLDGKFWGCYHAAKYAAPKLPPDGSITFVSGLFGWRPGVGGAVAGAANAAVESLARTLAVELAPVRVNSVLAGVIDTPMLDALLGDGRQAMLDAVAASLPVKRVGRPEDVADAVVFLMGNGFVTGTVLQVTGGALIV